MPRRTPFDLRKLPVAVAVAMFLAAVTVVADGPVLNVSGVVQTADSDSDGGEGWGRDGGRTLTYAVVSTDAYATLSWGSVTGTLPGAAFDGQLDASELMAFDPTSNLAGGQARWTGEAVIVVNGSPTAVPTRFLLTVTDGPAPVPLTMIAGGPTPGIDVMGRTGFSANLLFEMLWAGQWQPLLDQYDALPTPAGPGPGSGGPVLTSFQHGFYFTEGSTGLTIEQHDTNITNQLNAVGAQLGSVKDDTAFLRIDTVGRLQSVQSSLSQVQGSVSQVQGGVSQVQGSVDQLTHLVQNLPGAAIPDDIATTGDVANAKNDLTQMLLILFGLAPCPEPAMCEAATLISDLARQTLDVQVVDFNGPGSPERRTWLVRTSLNGAPAAAELVTLVAINRHRRAPSSATDVTPFASVTPLMPGLMEVTLEAGRPSLKDMAFHFTVRHATGSEVLEASSVVGNGGHK